MYVDNGESSEPYLEFEPLAMPQGTHFDMKMVFISKQHAPHHAPNYGQ